MATVVTTQVGPDGVLHLNLPLSTADANRTVRVTVEPVDEAATTTPTDREAWLRFIARTAGSIPDPTFERPPQGQLEERESLP